MQDCDLRRGAPRSGLVDEPGDLGSQDIMVFITLVLILIAIDLLVAFQCV
jgi:hypothetical protein